MMSPVSDTIDLALPLAGDAPLLPGDEFHQLMRELREDAAMATVSFLGAPCRIVTRYAELDSAFRDDEGFPAGPTYATTIEPCQGVTFESLDGPEHHLLRALTTKELRARPIERYAHRHIGAIADRVIDDLLAESDGGTDLVATFTKRFPFLVFGHRMGLPEDRADEYFRWSFDLLGYPGDNATGLAAAAELTAYVEPVLTERRECPADDMISSMVTAEKDGRALDDEEIRSHVRAIFAAGAATTHHGIGNTLYALLSHPAALARLRADLSLVPAAVDEMLRWEPPIGVLPRLAPFDTVVAGEEVPRGTFVLMGIASANRDQAVHTDPDRFDIDRRPARVLTFGFGSHHCPGTHLAKAQITVGIERLLARLPRLRLTDVEAARPSGAVMRGPRTLPVEF
jgi:cytochrome P450